MNYKLLIILFVLLSIFACQDEKIEDNLNEPKKTEEPINEETHLKGWVRIKLKQEPTTEPQLTTRGVVSAGLSGLDQLTEKLHATQMERVFPYSGKFEARARKMGMHLWYDVYFETDISLTRAVSDFSELPEIDKVEPIRRIKNVESATAIAAPLQYTSPKAGENMPFNDPQLKDQWHYYNDGAIRTSVAGADINVFPAWKITTGSPEVIVAVVDGGIDIQHEDLAATIWTNEAEKNGTANNDDNPNGYKDDIHGWNFVDNNATIVAHPHGTHVAGTIAAVNNNGKGVCGVAGGSGQGDGIRLMSCQIFKTDPNDPNKDLGTRRLPAAIKYGADNGAVISQNSWGYELEEGSIPSFDAGDPERLAIDYFIEHAGMDENGNQTGPMKGGIVIFAAGNDNKDYLAYPPAYDKVLSVASMNVDFRKAYYSNYAKWVDITAPGGSYLTSSGAQNTKGQILSTLPNNQYGYMQGTSMACPHVSGIAALAVSKYGVGHPGYTPDLLLQQILGTAKNIDTYNSSYVGKMGAGYIDAGTLIQTDEGIPPQEVKDLSINWKSTKATLTWSVTKDEDNGTPTLYEIYWSNQPLNTLNPSAPPASVNVIKIQVRNLNVGSPISAEITGLTIHTPYYVAIAGVDIFGNRSGLVLQNGETTTNATPIITPEETSPFVLKAHETKNFVYHISDPENNTWTFNFTNGTGGGATATREGESITITVKGPMTNKTGDTPGNYDGTLSVTDEDGAEAHLKISYQIEANHAPALIGSMTLQDIYFSTIGTAQTIDLTPYFTDADGENLQYTVVCPVNGLINSSVENGKLTISALKSGQAEITIEAYDYFKKMAKSSFRIMSRNGSQEVDLYPNPVIDKLNIRMGQDVNGPVRVKLYNSAGTLVIESDVTITPFAPGILDISKLSGGTYTLILNHNGREIKRNIIKL